MRAVAPGEHERFHQTVSLAVLRLLRRRRCCSCDEHIVNLTLRNIHLKQGGPWLCDDVVSLPAVPCSALLFAFPQEGNKIVLATRAFQLSVWGPIIAELS